MSVIYLEFRIAILAVFDEVDRVIETFLAAVFVLAPLQGGSATSLTQPIVWYVMNAAGHIFAFHTAKLLML